MSSSRKPDFQHSVWTTIEVAELFGVDSKTIQRQTKLGKVPHFKTVSGHYRYHKSEVLAFFEKKLKESKP